MNRTLCVFLTAFLCCVSFMSAAATEEAVSLMTPNGAVKGTLLLPESGKAITVVLFISGSGPTDRDGNNPMMKNNSLKKVADTLASRGVASLRYDKRGVGASKEAMKSEAELRFEDYIDDATSWVSMLKKDKRFDRVVVIGHSEGSLIGMIAAGRAGAHAFISIAGASEPANDILRRQLIAAPGGLADVSFPIIDSLSAGHLVSTVPSKLNMIFRPSVQPYLISWFKYSPVREIANLSIPILIIQGTNDLQVLEADGRALAKANQRANLVLIEGMNHVLRVVEVDRMKNTMTYSNPELPIAPELLKAIFEFTK